MKMGGVFCQRQQILWTLSEVTWQNSHNDLSSKIRFNNWLKTQSLDPHVLFEAIWLEEVFAFLSVEAAISYMILCTPTNLYQVAVLSGALKVLYPWWDVWEVSLLEQARKGQFRKEMVTFPAMSFLGQRIRSSWRWRNWFLSSRTVFVYPKG